MLSDLPVLRTSRLSIHPSIHHIPALHTGAIMLSEQIWSLPSWVVIQSPDLKILVTRSQFSKPPCGPKEILQWAECAQQVSSWQTGVGGRKRGRLGGWGVPGPEEGVPHQEEEGWGSWLFGEFTSSCSWFGALAEFSIHSFSSFCISVSYPLCAGCWGHRRSQTRPSPGWGKQRGHLVSQAP